MADSLFDNRYRYDYIYPRGRSGETLRAVDTQASDRPVVIKRPAPNDAPPIRAGQEVSILTERKALMRLAGHPVLTELLNTGQFVVGGVPHQYIVVERGQGYIIADLVIELAARGERLPELEMLVIMDRLLDLLQSAHQNDIVYNDVDAKHLFWDRENYRLKVIDWGNAVFLEGDEITPQGVSRQSDIGQVGELLYFILTGGRRVEIPRDAPDDAKIDFGQDGERVHSRLQSIASRAVHPNLRVRYHSIAELRRELSDYRTPIMRERDLILGRVSERLRRERSRDELTGLLDTLAPALAMDPGYRPAGELEHEIRNRLQDLEIAGDIDAARIYLESGNWSRALALLEELRPKARGTTAMLVNLQHDFVITLMETNVRPLPPVIVDSITLIFEHHPERAAYNLVLAGGDDTPEHALMWLLAERISSHVPEALVLRPNLYRLDRALVQLEAEGVPTSEPHSLLMEINTRLKSMPSSNNVSLSELRDTYRAIVDGLTALNTLMGAVNTGRNLPNHRLPFSSLERALNAAMALADNMHVIGKQATSSPRDAQEALDNSRLIDPNNPAWDMVGRLLDSLYELLGTYQTYVPAADGSDLSGWLRGSQEDLQPFIERLFDEMLAGMVEGLRIAERAWESYDSTATQGNRAGAIHALTQATEAVGTISPTLAGWFNQLRSVITNARYIERHTLYGGLGRALADGWEAFDRGRLADAEQLGQRAVEIAQNDSQRFAANRLQKLSELTRTWVERNGVNVPDATKAALVSIERMFTVSENETRENFARQMPSNETYLKAMSKGLVELYTRSNTAAVRILFMTHVLTGTLDAHDGELEDAEFWRQAALKTLEGVGARHPAARSLEELISRRQDILAGVEVINRIDSPQAIPQLTDSIKQLENNSQSRLLAAGIHSLRELQAALRDWSDGEFRPAGIKLENAINAVNEVEQAANITLTPYRTWLIDLQAHAADLHTRSRRVRQVIEAKPAEPDSLLLEAHERQYQVTHGVLGESYAATLHQWLQTYEAFLAAYTDESIRRSGRLSRFNELFRVMFIDRHPAYPLYRHWYDLTEQSPEFPAPPTNEPTPRLDESDTVAEDDYAAVYDREKAPAPARRLPRFLWMGGVGLVILIGLLLVINRPDAEVEVPPLALTITDTPTADLVATAAAEVTEAALLAGSQQPDANPTVTTATLNTPTSLPVALDTSTTVTEAASSPTTTLTPTSEATDTPAPTWTATHTETPTASPTATLPPQGLQGQQDLFALFNRMETYPWDQEVFSLGVDGNFWRFGVGMDTPGEVLRIPLSVDTLETYYGNNAAGRIRRVEATMTLTSYNPPLLLDNDVYFGLLLQDATNPANTVGMQVTLAQAGIINLGARTGEEVRNISQRSVGSVTARIRLERDLNNGAVTLFFNNEQIGQALPFVPVGQALEPVIFVKDGGVIVSLSDWTVALN